MSNNLGFMDLSRQVKLHKNEFMSAIENVIDDTAFSGGKYVEKFEKEFANYLGVKFCSALSNGTDALFMAMKVIGIGDGDEVIIPANTFIASAWGAFYCGAKPVFVDIKSDTWEIDSSKIECVVTEKTKAIVGVHLYGNAFDFDAVKVIADKYNLKVVEDCAQAHGALYKGRKVGTLGDIACFSFYPGKNLGAFGEAGAVVTNNEEYFKKIEIMKNHGSSIRYRHEIEGYNCRMDGINGAVLSTKLQWIDSWNDRRRDIANKYLKSIKNSNIKTIKINEDVVPVWHLFEVQVDEPNRFMVYMKEKGIECGRHYPIPCHLQKVFEYLHYSEGDLPFAEKHAAHCVTLPMFPELTDDEVNMVIDACNHYV